LKTVSWALSSNCWWFFFFFFLLLNLDLC
jgi:hypothetical protein